MTNQKMIDITIFITALFILIYIIARPRLKPKPTPTPIPTPTASVTTQTSEPAPTKLPTQYSDLNLSAADIRLLAQMEYAEARGEPENGRIAVIKVALNRLKHPKFPKTVHDVVYAPGQFSTAPYLKYIEPKESDYIIVYKAIADEGPILDPDIVYFSQQGENDRVAFTIGNHVFCRV